MNRLAPALVRPMSLRLALLFAVFLFSVSFRTAPVRAIEVPRSQMIDPIDAGLSEARGFLRLGRAEDAIRRLQMLNAQHPGEWRVLDFLTSALIANGRAGEAESLLKASAEKMSDPVPALINLERAYRTQQKWDDAVSTCLDIQNRAPGRNDWVFDELESLIRSDRAGKEALRGLEDASHKHPMEDRLADLWIRSLFLAGQSDRALKEAAARDRDRKAKGSI